MPARSEGSAPDPGQAPGNAEAKAALRRELIAAREAAGPSARAAWSAAIRDRVRALEDWGRARVVGLFAPIRGEVDAMPLLGVAREAGKAAAFPKALPGGGLAFYAVTTAGDLSPGAFGVLEPRAEDSGRVEPGAIDLLLVPGAGFDETGMRIGFGGGYYDRFLAGAAVARVFTVGLAYECQVRARLPAAPHDRRVRAVVTEKRLLLFD
jgi:5-formyltetrahydrofolate cyclo-ligase